MLKWFTLFTTFILLLPIPSSGHYGARFEPPDGMFYHGVGWNYQNSMRLYARMFPLEHHPLILQVNTSLPGFRGTDVARVVGAFTNTVFHADSQYIEYSLHFQDQQGMLDSVFALTDELDNYIDTLAIAFRQVDRPFFLRIGFEFNGAWNPYHPFIYPLAFRKLVEELRDRDVDNFATVWCYEADAAADFADSTEDGWKWYPGDDVVDWFGLDPFDAAGFDPDLPDSTDRGGRRNITKKGKTEAFLRFARERGKPVYLNELSAVRIDITPDEEDVDSADGIADWEAWFVPFFEFLGNHPEIKGMNYIDIDWSLIDQYEQQGWRDARLEINSYIRNRWVAALMDERFINVGYDITKPESVRDEEPLQPAEMDLSVYPNPFNARTVASYELRVPSRVNLSIYDSDGRFVWTLVDGWQSFGKHRMVWNAAGYPTGLYWLQLADDRGGKVAQPVVLVK